MSMQKLGPRRDSATTSGEPLRQLSAQEIQQVAGGYYQEISPIRIEPLPYPLFPPQDPYPGPLRPSLP